MQIYVSKTDFQTQSAFSILPLKDGNYLQIPAVAVCFDFFDHAAYGVPCATAFTHLRRLLIS